MGKLLGVLLLVGQVAAGQAVLLVKEDKVSARLTPKGVHLSLPVSHGFKGDIAAYLKVELLDAADKALGSATEKVTLKQGMTMAEVSVEAGGVGLWTRIRYQVTPTAEDGLKARGATGIVALMNVCGELFEVHARANWVSGKRDVIGVYAETLHPLTRQPVGGMEWAVEGNEKAVVKQVRPGVYEIEVARRGGEDNAVQLTARRERFAQEVSVEAPERKPYASMQTDKPIYQPGQVMHWRAVVMDRAGEAMGDAPVKVEIRDGEHELMHEATLRTSRFGVVNLDWRLPQMAKPGAYAIELEQSGDDDERLGRHVVRVGRYELPSFVVRVKGDRDFYLPGQMPRVSVRAEYLHGKAVARGKVRIVRMLESGGDDSRVIAKGEANAAGDFSFAFALSEAAAVLRLQTYHLWADERLVAYVTDPLTGKMERKEFRLRMTRKPLHLHTRLVLAEDSLRAYVATQRADGTPIAAVVKVIAGGETRTVRTNRYGVARVDGLPPLDYGRSVRFEAVDANGTRAEAQGDLYAWDTSGLQVRASKTMHRVGEGLRLEVKDLTRKAGEQAVVLHVVGRYGWMASKSATLRNGVGQVEFAYQPDFAGQLTVFAWHASRKSNGSSAAVSILYPEGRDLKVTVKTDKAQYRPQDEAAVRVETKTSQGRAVEAAVGIAIVDQAAMEKGGASTNWFACELCADEMPSLFGGVTRSDLFAALRRGEWNSELDLVAEAMLVRKAWNYDYVPKDASVPNEPAFAVDTRNEAELRQALEKQYLEKLEIPRSEEEFGYEVRQLWARMVDPWNKRYRVSFGVEGKQRVVKILGAGPDKLFGTPDDRVAMNIEKPYFLPTERVIRDIVKRAGFMPRTLAEANRMLLGEGMNLAAMKDPWGQAYRLSVAIDQDKVELIVTSAGPDGKWGTEDQVIVMELEGRYSGRDTDKIERVLSEQVIRPGSLGEFRAAMARAGVDLAAMRDPFGRPYEFVSHTVPTYGEQTELYRVAQWGGGFEVRERAVPVNRLTQRIVMRSNGHDGKAGTRDDYICNYFVVRSEVRRKTLPVEKVSEVGGGQMAVQILDARGGVAAQAELKLVAANGSVRIAETDADGNYTFQQVVAGVYAIEARSEGLTATRIEGIALEENQRLALAVELIPMPPAAVAEVRAEAPMIQTMETSVSETRQTGTPRLRQDFPETLFWVPEGMTGVDGVWEQKVKLADNVTRWKMAVVASTVDGRLAEAEGEFVATQPLLLNLETPLVVTAGDEIGVPVTVSQYGQGKREIGVEVTAEDGLKLVGSGKLGVVLGPGESQRKSVTVVVGERYGDVAVKAVAGQAVAGQGEDGDAVRRRMRVVPDGQRVEATSSVLLRSRAVVKVDVPQGMIAGATRAELRLYPSVAAMLEASVAAMMRMPHGCNEQMISTGFANLVAMREAQRSGVSNAAVERAKAQVRMVVQRVVSGVSGNGGVSYWEGGEGDVAVTSLALEFLVEAQGVSRVERSVLARMAQWILKEGGASTLVARALAVRALGRAQAAGVKVDAVAWSRMWGEVAAEATADEDPYVLAAVTLAAMETGNTTVGMELARRLVGMQKRNDAGGYWEARRSSPFYGWGRTGRYETTGMAVQALAAAEQKAGEAWREVIEQGAVYLVRSRQWNGAWDSTQATLQAARGIVAAGGELMAAPAGAEIEVRQGGRVVSQLTVAQGEAGTPVYVDVSRVVEGSGEIELVSKRGSGLMLAMLGVEQYVKWPEAKPLRAEGLGLEVKFGPTKVKVGEAVMCEVMVEKVGFAGYGMMLAEIGLPPGATVDRAALDAMVASGREGLRMYEVEPDKVVLYLWPRAAGTNVKFGVIARQQMRAKSGASRVYDYNNTEAMTEVRGVEWEVRP